MKLAEACPRRTHSVLNVWTVTYDRYKTRLIQAVIMFCLCLSSQNITPAAYRCSFVCLLLLPCS